MSPTRPARRLAAPAGRPARRPSERASALAALAALGSALGPGCAGVSADAPTEPPAREPANLYVPDSCPDVTQLSWPARPGEHWTRLVMEPGCVRIESPPRVASQLRARCVQVDERWNVTPVSDWVAARRATPEERAALCPRRPGQPSTPPPAR